MTRNEGIVYVEAEIKSIDTRIDRAWAAIKADLARKEWLRQQLIMASNDLVEVAVGEWQKRSCANCRWRIDSVDARTPKQVRHCRACRMPNYSGWENRATD